MAKKVKIRIKRTWKSKLSIVLPGILGLYFICVCCQSEKIQSSNQQTKLIDNNQKRTTIVETTAVKEKSEKQFEEVVEALKTKATQTSVDNKQPQRQQPSSGSTQFSCQYEKGQWQECTPDGFQLKIQHLKKRGKNGEKEEKVSNSNINAFTEQYQNDAFCEPVKMIRRDCKPVGCKYARGQWSSLCDNGQRVRIDRLVATIDGVGKSSATNHCKAHRKVTKDCRRTCHYKKSAWSDCTSGMQTRNLTLASEPDPAELFEGKRKNEKSNGEEQSEFGQSGNEVEQTRKQKRGKKQQQQQSSLVTSVSPLGQNCAKFKLMKRECRSPPTSSNGNSTAATAAVAAVTASSSAANTAAQKRRLKQLQRQQQSRLKQKQQQQQQQQQQRASSPSDPTGKSSSTSTATTTSTMLSVPNKQTRR